MIKVYIRLDYHDFNIRCPRCKESKPKGLFKNTNRKLPVDYVTHTRFFPVCNHCQKEITLYQLKGKEVINN